MFYLDPEAITCLQACHLVVPQSKSAAPWLPSQAPACDSKLHLLQSGGQWALCRQLKVTGSWKSFRHSSSDPTNSHLPPSPYLQPVSPRQRPDGDKPEGELICSFWSLQSPLGYFKVGGNSSQDRLGATRSLFIWVTKSQHEATFPNKVPFCLPDPLCS